MTHRKHPDSEQNSRRSYKHLILYVSKKYTLLSVRLAFLVRTLFCLN